MFTKMVDLEYDDDAMLDMPMPMATKPRYPWGLKICLTHVELEKLGLEADCEVGCTVDIRALGEVTSVSKDDNGCRIEIQLQKIAVEDEDAEDMEEEV